MASNVTNARQMLCGLFQSDYANEYSHRKSRTTKSFFASMLLIHSIFLPTIAQAKDHVELGQVGFAQWRCAAWAILSKEPKPNTDTLFQEGYERMKELVSDIIEQKVSEKDMRELPVGIGWFLTGGPSLEFRLGALWANLYDYQYDELMPPAKEGTSFEERMWVLRSSAGERFDQGNCKLL